MSVGSSAGCLVDVIFMCVINVLLGSWVAVTGSNIRLHGQGGWGFSPKVAKGFPHPCNVHRVECTGSQLGVEFSCLVEGGFLHQGLPSVGSFPASQRRFSPPTGNGKVGFSLSLLSGSMGNGFSHLCFSNVMYLDV